MRLSKNFTLSEITHSNTAKRLGIDNGPNKEHLKNIQVLVNNLIQPMRALLLVLSGLAVVIVTRNSTVLLVEVLVRNTVKVKRQILKCQVFQTKN